MSFPSLLMNFTNLKTSFDLLYSTFISSSAACFMAFATTFCVQFLAFLSLLLFSADRFLHHVVTKLPLHVTFKNFSTLVYAKTGWLVQSLNTSLPVLNGLGFNYRIGQSAVTNGSPPLRHFSVTVLPDVKPWRWALPFVTRFGVKPRV